MAKSKSDKSKVTGKPKNLLNSTVLNSFTLILIVVGSLLGYMGTIDAKARQTTVLNTLSQSVADGQAALLSQHVDMLQSQMAGLAQSSELASTLRGISDKSQPITDLQPLELGMRRAFPGATEVRLIPLGRLGIAELIASKVELNNNIEQDLVRRASNGEAAIPEAYLVNNRWLLSLAQPVQPEGIDYVMGVILVSFDQQYLKALLGQRDDALGQTDLVQRFGNKPQVIASAGSGGQNYLRTTQSTNVPHWQIEFTPSPTFVSQNSPATLMVWIALGASLLVILIACASTLSSLKKALTNNIQQVIEHPRGEFTLPGFAELGQHVQKAAREKEALVATAAEEPVARAAEKAQPAVADTPEPEPLSVPGHIFRAYDIRGVADYELTDDLCHALGCAIGSEALDQGQQSVVVAADGRNSSPRIRAAIVKGLQDSGRDVIDIGVVPTPLMYFATHHLETQSGVMITGSHNPPADNGIKVVIGGRALSGAAIQALKQRVEASAYSKGKGQYRTEDITSAYFDYIVNDIAIAQPLKVVVDAGNGVTGALAPRLLEELGCEVIPLFCEVDGNFPNHHPDPSVPANLADLIRTVREEGADLGIAFDGDGDRLGVATATGRIIPADQLLMIFAQDVVSRNPGADILFDVKCTRALNSLISQYGGRPIMWKTGHSFMKDKMQETGALLGGEFSGHIFFRERWFGFDDGMYSAARLIEILSTTTPDLEAHLQSFPQQVSTPEIKVVTTDNDKFSIIEALINSAAFGEGKLTTLDGLRVDYADGWGLVRASNTTAMLILRFEGETEDSLQRIKADFKHQLAAIAPQLDLNF